MQVSRSVSNAALEPEPIILAATVSDISEASLILVTRVNLACFATVKLRRRLGLNRQLPFGLIQRFRGYL